jgi:hypothetical protein
LSNLNASSATTLFVGLQSVMNMTHKHQTQAVDEEGVLR